MEHMFIAPAEVKKQCLIQMLELAFWQMRVMSNIHLKLDALRDLVLCHAPLSLKDKLRASTDKTVRFPSSLMCTTMWCRGWTPSSHPSSAAALTSSSLTMFRSFHVVTQLMELDQDMADEKCSALVPPDADPLGPRDSDPKRIDMEITA
ncbi:predicted protein [Histoplasma mississippiense (nom. inval.)]|uniref:predicted protein n=1 Tax=Ajellomyces capsulatus (strain NAm1 / WU24) TaxID=2059318 RepID=UPI000157BECA|nr:predicted protein [Histoplasma mississippiense (nom. inval.)]EDN06955.1 predicted protein [Histoplasma mississippiense (nom. inval.)]